MEQTTTSCADRVPVAPGINIWSGACGVGGALTNMTERAREKGGIQQTYPVTVNGVMYPDSEAAYQALKVPGNARYNDGLMIDILDLKFRQHRRLLDYVARSGGVAWLEQCSHLTQAKSPRFQSWEGHGAESRFIRNLAHGYQKATTGAGPLTRVVHLRQAPFDIYIGRRNGDLPESIWHNPFHIGEDGTREEVIAKFASYVAGRPELLAHLAELKGKTLGCWCKARTALDTGCHGDVLAALSEGFNWIPPEPAQKALF